MALPVRSIESDTLEKMSLLPESPTDLFCTPPPRESFQGPADEVPKLVAKAQKVKEINSAVNQFLDSHQDLFFEVFYRQVQLIMSRSQAFEDCHVTIYDKVLLILTQNGNELDNPPAIDFYCEEYLGINRNGGQTEIQKALDRSISLPTMLSQGFRKTESRSDSTPPVMSKPGYESNRRKYLKKTPQTEPKLQRLWDVYEKAHAEFLAVSEKRDQSTLTAAKFLRDTAENTMEYLKNRKNGFKQVFRASKTFNTAKETVVALCGGKKRKFDLAGTVPVQKYPRKREDVPTQPRHIRPETRFPDSSRRHYPGEMSMSHQALRGREHSGIPYGYTRPVDSYHPR